MLYYLALSPWLPIVKHSPVTEEQPLLTDEGSMSLAQLDISRYNGRGRRVQPSCAETWGPRHVQFQMQGGAKAGVQQSVPRLGISFQRLLAVQCVSIVSRSHSKAHLQLTVK